MARVEEADALPGPLERRGLRFAVADDGHRDELGVVERGAEGVREDVAQLSAFVDRARGLRPHVARDAPRSRELAKQPEHARAVAREVRIDLLVRPLEPDVRHHRRTAVPGAREEEHVRVALLDDAIEVGVNEAQPGRRPPVAEEPGLDVLRSERLGQQRVREQVDLPDRKVVRGAPPVVDADQVVVDRVRHRRSPKAAGSIVYAAHSLHRPRRGVLRVKSRAARTRRRIPCEPTRILRLKDPGLARIRRGTACAGASKGWPRSCDELLAKEIVMSTRGSSDCRRAVLPERGAAGSRAAACDRSRASGHRPSADGPGRALCRSPQQRADRAAGRRDVAPRAVCARRGLGPRFDDDGAVNAPSPTLKGKSP